MKISVSKLSEIESAQNIEIKKFNVFIGKNGTGKTYFAKLIYFIFSIRHKTSIYERMFDKKLRKLFDNNQDVEFSVEEQQRYLVEFRNSIRSKFHDFIGSRSDLFKNFSFELSPNLKTLIVKFEDFRSHSNITDLDKKNEYSDFVAYTGVNFVLEIFEIIDSHYLPAARANYMITYKYLFESQFNNLRNLLLKKSKSNRISILPEVENNFLSDIYKVNTKYHSDMYSFASKIENEIFRSGKLSIKNSKQQDLPTYEFRLNKMSENIELVSASSAVTELSPLIMYFRHKISQPDRELLIIDEPELSLHPDAQAKLVEILVSAANKGLALILVTHSPFILEALNNHLQKSKIKHKVAKKHINSFPALDSSDVSAYLFEDNTIKDILDQNTKLIDDKLLASFNKINSIYDEMRDIEWNEKAKNVFV